MKNEDKIVELLAEVLQKVDVVSVEVKGLKDDVKDLKDDVVKLNIIGAENSRAILKLADSTERRFTRLEKAVFKQNG